ncbi:hypothetical protein HG536_0D03870 [Torulaspora globosa]|uniref:Vacuolar protein sorting-associated protein 45 n=1 Tax=Torulaspora globosa TaxID=48254 RepID=A0A7G3ZH79_9SACH|nr:uncharacterized protein HG536_0D03870 [Torulaspora globosa]QLL32865.1 hypothetical protein HG536_0D03870 [Torulaspora globosa]
MDLFKVADYYVDRIVNSQSRVSNSSVAERSRIKALLLDKDTITTISMCTTQTELLNHEIYLVDTIENQNRDVMRHLRCLAYVSPTEETLQALLRELQNPKYGDYYIFFSNAVSKSQLERLAEADDLEVVSKVEEIYQDYHIINSDFFSLDIPVENLLQVRDTWEASTLIECTKSLTSLLLSLKLKPDIKFEANSRMCSKLAREVSIYIEQNEKTLFDFPKIDSTPMLVLLDRKNDPLTPLLQPWTYQSMLNEYIGIKGNIVDLSGIPDVDKDIKTVTLSPRQDAFFHSTMYSNFGELGDKVNQYVTTYKDKTHSNSQINTIEDIKRFIEKYPEFRKLSGNVAKHMAIVGELDRQLRLGDIWRLSEVEQNLAVHKDSQEDYQAMLTLLRDEKLRNEYKLKLACIYSLKHGENSERMDGVVQTLSQQLPAEEINLFHKFRTIFHADQTKGEGQGHLRDKDDLLSELAKKFNSRMGSGNNTEAENVYMQHVPEISTLLTDISKNKVSRDRLKTMSSSKAAESSPKLSSPTSPAAPPQDIVIFVVGGVTYEEARFVHQFNETMKNKTRVVLGGTSVLSTSDFMQSIRNT